MRANAAAMLLADYRSLGVPDLICISERGEVFGYAPYQESSSFNSTKKLKCEEDRLAITELLNKKQALLVELQHYEANAASDADVIERPSCAMPTNTRLQLAVQPDTDECCIQLAISTNNETVVRAALVFGEGVFETGETIARHPPQGSLRSILFIPMKPPRDVPVDIHIKALIGYPDSEQFHIFELTKHLPRFSMYKLLHTATALKHDSYVSFRITERVQRILIWINQNFLLDDEVKLEIEDAKELHLSFVCLRDRSRLDFDFEVDGQVTLTTTNIGLAGDLIQSLAVFLNISDLQSTANFPDTEKLLQEEIQISSEVGETRSRLAAESAEKAQLITALLPAAIDAASYDIKVMLSRYKEVILLNEELLTSCYVRRSSQEQTVSSLKNLHNILKQAARLRVGKYSKAVVSACRTAVQDGNTDALIKILRVGEIVK
ncbi:Bardet-Biedl syndrome 2 protein-like [Leptidea sinapis]|uniref:Bardet-Biedl syndrome 2 protein-like n=1 Tax=Leptidea sinapis TaxID=189913 RepID=UPI0021C38D2E|nr:Bardet-Biedl syndrome 2 protein-like [Leptidea sinapis]